MKARHGIRKLVLLAAVLLLAAGALSHLNRALAQRYPEIAIFETAN
ncbi:MAG: hypothetical protein ACRD04_04940 [Terriglobales bacterium]